MMSKYEQSLPMFHSQELTVADAAYPEQLKNIGEEPPVLYTVGNIDVLKTPLISIIGARKATPYGLACARLAGKVAAECGITVVSGGAIGCDSEAAKAALAAGGKTIVVPGCGPDILYPRSSDKLFFDAVMTGGCVLSNIAWGVEPRRGTFVSRNQIIAALSRSLIVCEAGLKSGTFTTASMAAELGKRIYSVPGSIFSSTSRGTNHLLEIGASIVSDEESLEMLISLDYGRLRLMSPGKKETTDELVRALIANPMQPGEIADMLDLDISNTFALLADYEAAGVLERQMDGRYSPTTSALLNK